MYGFQPDMAQHLGADFRDQVVTIQAAAYTAFDARLAAERAETAAERAETAAERAETAESERRLAESERELAALLEAIQFLEGILEEAN